MTLTNVILGAGVTILLALLGMVWHGGQTLGGFTNAMTSLKDEVAKLREQREQDVVTMTKAIQLLDDIEQRVEKLELRADRRRS